MKLDLTEGSIKMHIRKMAIPASIGMFFSTMYNVVDTYYAGLLSTEALAALSISFPVFFIIIAMGSGLSTGASAIIANLLGEKKKLKAHRYAAQIISYGIIFSIIITIVGLIIAPHLFKILGASGEYLNLALSYINIIFIGTIFFLGTFILNSILMAAGDSKTYRNFLIFSFFLNLLLDPWFMFGGFGIPAMGVKGVAFATILINAIGVLYILKKVIKLGMIDKTCLHKMIPRKVPFLDISKQSIPASINMMTIGIGIFVITYYVSKFGQDAVASYGIITRVEQIALLPTIGLNFATLAVIGQNNGAKKYERVKKAIYQALKYGLLIMTGGSIMMFVFARQLMDFFTDSSPVIKIGITALQIAAFTSWSYVILGLLTSSIQGMKKPMFAIYIGVTRQIILPLIVFSFFVKENITSIWFSILIMNWVIAAFVLTYTRRLLVRLVPKDPEMH